MKFKKQGKNYLAHVLTGVCILCASLPVSAEEFSTERPSQASVSFSGVYSVNDQDYFLKLRELLGASHASILIAVSGFSATLDKKDAASILLEDVVNAAKRNVKVRLFVNTFPADWEETLFFRPDQLEYLKTHGVQVHFVHPKYQMEDRLVIMDEKRVLEGGPVWTHAGLTEGFSSATLVDSEALAKKKRTRLEMLPLWDLKTEKDQKTTGVLPIPLFLLQDVKYFPEMVRLEDGDSFRIFLALLEKFYDTQNAQMSVSLTELGNHLPAGDVLDKGKLVYQVYQTIERLSNTYELIRVVEKQPEKIELELLLKTPLEPQVRILLSFFHENYAKTLSPRAIYAYFIMTHQLQVSGQSPVWLGTEHNFEQDYPMTAEVFRGAAAELRETNLIEVFPVNLRQGSGYVGPDVFEYRYQINEIPTMAERLEMWSRLRDEWGEDEVKKARKLAALLGEPEDPAVVTAYIKLLSQYSFQDIEGYTQHLATLPPASTPELLRYLGQLLRYETQGTRGLGTN